MESNFVGHLEFATGLGGILFIFCISVQDEEVGLGRRQRVIV
jgi:hypothetical protein